MSRLMLACTVLLCGVLIAVAIGPHLRIDAADGYGPNFTATIINDLSNITYQCNPANETFKTLVQEVLDEFGSLVADTPRHAVFDASTGFAIDKPAYVYDGDATYYAALTQVSIDKVEAMAEFCGMTPGELCPKRANDTTQG